jgi:hypothetical protein
MKMIMVQNPAGFDVPAGSIILWYGLSTNVPAGFEIYTTLMGQFAMGGAAYDATARGALTHAHNFPNIETKANHTHTGSVNVGGYVAPDSYGDYYSSTVAAQASHSHSGSVGVTAAGGHTHTLTQSGAGSSLPKFKRLYYIRKL